MAFVRGGNDLVVRSLADGKEAIAVRGDGKAIGAVTWTPDGAHLLFNAGASTIRHEQTPEYSGTKIIYTITERTAGRDLRRRRNRRRADAAAACRRRHAARLDRRRRASSSIASRPTSSGARSPWPTSTGGEPTTLHEDVDDKFWSIPGQAGSRRAAVARRQVDRVPQRSRRLGSPLRDAARPGGDADSDHQGQVRSVAAALVARQHADRVRRQRAGPSRRPPSRRRDDRPGSGAGDGRR